MALLQSWSSLTQISCKTSLPSLQSGSASCLEQPRVHMQQHLMSPYKEI